MNPSPPAPPPDPDLSDRMAAPEAGFLVEPETRLSRSLLWEAQRRFFGRQGIDAWRRGIVPSYVTNNPALAQGYAAMVLGHLRDLRNEGAVWSAGAPATILELGAGGGRFAFLFLQAFEALLAASPLAGTPFRYVMTDFAEANIAFWRDHPALAPFVAAGRLDFARFDAEGDDRATLLETGVTLGPDDAATPLIVIANYVFDGLSQDAFALRDGILMQTLVSLTADVPAADLDDPDLLGRLQWHFTDHPLDEQPYAEPRFNRVLDAYRTGFPDGSLLFPSAALRCIDRLAAMGGGRLLLLTGDRGEVHGAYLAGEPIPKFAMHGSFSLPVNYHAIGAWVHARGGVGLTTSYRHGSLAVSAFLLGHDPAGLTETRLAFDTTVEQGGPDDFFVLRQGLQPHYATLEIRHLLALLRLGGWDPKLVGDCAPALWDRLPEATDAHRAELVLALEQSWAHYYHLGEAQDLAFDFGMLLYGLGAYEAALARFSDSRRLYGDDARTRWNEGMCHAAAGREAEAGRSLAAAFALDPGFAVPQALLGKQAEEDETLPA